jgi:hypothetical protein
MIMLTLALANGDIESRSPVKVAIDAGRSLIETGLFVDRKTKPTMTKAMRPTTAWARYRRFLEDA